ncbi:MAG: YdcF family protein [Clostridium sp.]|nr:YdcF family protein [Clostridium sp.]
MGVLSVILSAIGIFSLIYYFVLVLSSGFTIAFSEFWLVIGIVALIVSKILKKIILGQVNIKKNVLISVGVICLIVISTFTWVEGMIICSGNKTPKSDADYLIVLGAQVKGNVPSHSLSLRIDGAIDYLENNPNTIAIASGGQGPGENLSEAEVIKAGLISGEIGEKRIITEDKSTSTVENLKFSKELIEDKDSNIVIVTNKFHIMRACMIAKKLGFTNVSGYAVKSSPMVTVNCYVREFFAVVKDKVVGNI